MAWVVKLLPYLANLWDSRLPHIQGIKKNPRKKFQKESSTRDVDHWPANRAMTFLGIALAWAS